jgi:menaquinone-specific isochorismate synthase
LSDPKEQEEHRIVVEDIREALRDAGTVRIGQTSVLRLPRLAHLFTPIEFQPAHEGFEFGEMVRRLHPTAALGASPRSPEALRWLRESDREDGREMFGAPFGVQREDGSGLCLVSIRNASWKGTSLRIGSGVGVVAASELTREIEELELKREQTKSLLGLAREA